jgi:hypothetical protein
MIDLKDTYIKNDGGELLETYFNRAVELGLHDDKVVCKVAYMKDRYVTCSSGCDTLQSGCFAGKELTLEDFKPTNPVDPKLTKRVKVDCNFKSFYEAVSEILNSGETYFVDGVAEDLSWYVKDESFLSDETLGYLLQDYDMLYRYENKALTKYEFVIDYMDSLATVGEFTDFNDYLQGTVDKGEFVKMCKFIVELEEGE